MSSLFFKTFCFIVTELKIERQESKQSNLYRDLGFLGPEILIEDLEGSSWPEISNADRHKREYQAVHDNELKVRSDSAQ